MTDKKAEDNAELAAMTTRHFQRVVHSQSKELVQQ